MTAKISLGPVLFHWDPEALRDFYFRIADEAPVDTVCVGEVVCGKRLPFVLAYLDEVIGRLERAGKEVVISSLALVVTKPDQDQIRDVTVTNDRLVEANELGTTERLAGRPHIIGPFVNVYNEDTLAFLQRRGAVRVCPPPELPAAAIEVLARAGIVELEVLVFGRLPLAISSRCYHARHHGLSKAQCRFVCGRDPDGMTIRTLDGEPFLAINGTQTLSFNCCNLLADLNTLRRMGVKRFRLSPHRIDMVAVADVFRNTLDGRSEAGQALERLSALVGDMPFSNGFFRGTEGRALTLAQP